MVKTKTDPGVITRAVEDEPMRLREWGRDETFPLPPHRSGDWTIGSGTECWLQLQDSHGFVSRRHAMLKLDGERWIVADAGSKNGLWVDGERTASTPLLPGAEIMIGHRRLVVESPRVIRQHALLSRMLGWSAEQAPVVDRALRTLREFGHMRMPLWLTGADDLIAIARRLHREVAGEAPFVVGKLRGNAKATEDSLRAAQGGTLCVLCRATPGDLHALRALSADREQRCRLAVCAPSGTQMTSVDVPRLGLRRDEIDRIVDEYAEDAIATLGASPDSFTPSDRAWLIDRGAESLGEIELATLRMIAIREYGGVTHAAPRLGVTHSALSRWLARRVVRTPRRRSPSGSRS